MSNESKRETKKPVIQRCVFAGGPDEALRAQIGDCVVDTINARGKEQVQSMQDEMGKDLNFNDASLRNFAPMLNEAFANLKILRGPKAGDDVIIGRDELDLEDAVADVRDLVFNRTTNQES